LFGTACAALCITAAAIVSSASVTSVGSEESHNPQKRRLVDTLVWDNNNYQLYKDEEEFRVNTATMSAQELSDVAALTSGGYVVTFTNQQSPRHARGQKYNSDGTPNGNEFFIDEVTDATSVAALSGGGFVVTYVHPILVPGNSDVHVAVYPSTGFTPVIFNIDLLGHQSDPSVAGLANDGFVVAFENNDGALSGIFAHVYDASRTLVAAVAVNTQIANSQYNPHVAASPDGLTFVVTWQSNGQVGGSGIDVVARRFSSDGVALGSEILVNSYTPQTQSNPRVAFFPEWTTLRDCIRGA